MLFDVLVVCDRRRLDGEERASERARGKGCRWTRRGGSFSTCRLSHLFLPGLVQCTHADSLSLRVCTTGGLGWSDRRSIASSQVTSRSNVRSCTGPVRSEVRGVRIGGVGSAAAQRRSWKEMCPELSPLTSHYFICIQSHPFPIL